MDSKIGPINQPQSDGVPVPVVDIAEARVRKNKLEVRDWWLTYVLGGALAALTGCGAGSAEPSYQVQGAIRAYTSGGPVDVIVVRRTPAVQQ